MMLSRRVLLRQESGVSEEIPGVNACWIPKLDERSQRILEIRSKLISLQGLVDSGTILKMYDVSVKDIELLAFVEEELEKMREQDKSTEHNVKHE